LKEQMSKIEALLTKVVAAIEKKAPPAAAGKTAGKEEKKAPSTGAAMRRGGGRGLGPGGGGGGRGGVGRVGAVGARPAGDREGGRAERSSGVEKSVGGWPRETGLLRRRRRGKPPWPRLSWPEWSDEPAMRLGADSDGGPRIARQTQMGGRVARPFPGPHRSGK